MISHQGVALVLERLGGVALVNEVCCWVWALRFNLKSSCQAQHFSLSVFFSADQDASSQSHAYIPATMIFIDQSSETASKPSIKYFLLK